MRAVTCAGTSLPARRFGRQDVAVGGSAYRLVRGVVVVFLTATTWEVTAMIPLSFAAVLALVPAVPGASLMLGQARAYVQPGRGRHRRITGGRKIFRKAAR